MRQEVKGVDANVHKLSDRLVDAESTSVIQAYERRIRKLERGT